MSLLTLSNLLSWSAQVAAITAAALVTIKLVRLDAPAVRYLMLRIVLAVCLLLPFVQPYRATPSEHAMGPAPATAMTTRSPLTASAARVPDQPLAIVPVAMWPALLTLIVAGAAARFAWIGLGVVRLRRLRRAGELAPVADDLVEIQKIVRTTATIRYVQELGQPVTFGFRRPIVLLPESLREQPDTIRRAVLAHELWHVRRRDWMWTVCEESVRAIFWFHPGVWMLLSAIQSAREEVVDELTIMSTGSRRNYLNALLTYADRPPLLAATAFARRRHLMYRVMLISKEAVMSARRVVASGALLAAAVLFVGYRSIHAFPMTDAAAPQSVDDRGPLERRARPITPENPVPRRTFSVPAEYPTEAEQLGLRGTVTVRVTVDETGRVAETRTVGFRFASGATGTQPPRRAQEEFQQASQAMMTAATTAVGQWLYAAPAEGPLSFSVSIPVGPADDPPPPPPPPPPPTVRGAAVPPPPPPPPPPGVTTGWEYSDGTARVGGKIKAPYKTHHVAPIYPPEAQAARIQGIVILEARIEPNGRVSEARVIRSVPALDDAAVEAVRQWHFTPTLVDGVAVPVIMVTTVNFTLP